MKVPVSFVTMIVCIAAFSSNVSAQGQHPTHSCLQRSRSDSTRCVHHQDYECSRRTNDQDGIRYHAIVARIKHGVSRLSTYRQRPDGAKEGGGFLESCGSHDGFGARSQRDVRTRRWQASRLRDRQRILGNARRRRREVGTATDGVQAVLSQAGLDLKRLKS